MMSQIGKVLALFAVLFMLASPQGLSAEGLRGGFDDAFGPRFHPDARQAPPDSKHRPRHGFDRAERRPCIGTKSPSMPAGSTTRPSRRRRIGSSASNSGPARASRAMAIVHHRDLRCGERHRGRLQELHRSGAVLRSAPR